MTTLDTHELDWRPIYSRLTEIVQPRPIALASTLDPDGSPNLAPFSFFNIVSANPPYIAFSPLLAGRTGAKKDTLRNLEKNPQCVVATVTAAIAERVNQASSPLPYGDSEFALTGLTPIPAQRVKAFCVQESPVNMECEVVDIHHYGEAGGAGNLIVLRVHLIHINDEVLNSSGQIDPGLLQAVGRMGGEDWCTTQERFAYARPDR